jgi:hypothetical protein
MAEKKRVPGVIHIQGKKFDRVSDHNKKAPAEKEAERRRKAGEKCRVKKYGTRYFVFERNLRK